MSVTDRTIVLAGATSASGLAVARSLVASGARVIATGRSAERLEPLRVIGVEVEVADATSLDEMTELAARLERVDAVLPLVGGWRGGGGLAGQSDADFAALLPALDAVRATSRAFDEALRAAPAGRFAIISSTAVGRPLAGGANYAAVKAASEAWARAVAQGFAKAAREAGEPLRAASV
ncbi:SDR family NAD(P)-dependent oxidoreductase, partial [uncultured Microbacterium sp.]|uniref:SDR family NAD(P)-dependent oxidoreductase n=1 Tax=uncultured Microbacterium sp. TaxID=191216 RepID=UPI0028D4C6F8